MNEDSEEPVPYLHTYTNDLGTSDWPVHMKWYVSKDAFVSPIHFYWKLIEQSAFLSTYFSMDKIKPYLGFMHTVPGHGRTGPGPRVGPQTSKPEMQGS